MYTSPRNFTSKMKTGWAFILAFMTNSFSKCTTCTTLERQLEKTTCVKTRARYRQLKEEHNERQMMERKYYYSKREASRKAPARYMSLIVDGMDQSKTNLPHFTGRIPKSINGADLLKTHITGVINHGHGGFYTFVDVNEYPHDPNLTINIILKTLKRTAEMNENSLSSVCYIQADNCAHENKNRYVLAFCELLVAEKVFDEVHLSFLFVGHTHEDVDAAFSKVAEKLRTNEAETLNDLLNLIPKSEEIAHMFDVKNWLSPHISDIEKHSEPLHFKFSKKDDKVIVNFKGQQNEPWCELEGNILKSMPSGEPATIVPDYGQINIEKQSKQIETVCSLFNKKDTLTKWKSFFELLKAGGRHPTEVPPWTLNVLPRQQENNINVENMIPPEVRELILKETKVPKFRIKKRQGRNTKPVQSSNRKEEQHSSKQRKTPIQTISFRVLIPLTNDTKKHIWLKIYLDLCFLCIMMSLVAIIIDILLGLLCLLGMLQNMKLIFSVLVSVHIGTAASCTCLELMLLKDLSIKLSASLICKPYMSLEQACP